MRTTAPMIALDLPSPKRKIAEAMRNRSADVVSWVKSLINRRAANRLLDLDDHILADIGLSASEVHEVLRNHRMHQDPSMQLTMLARKRALRCLI